MCFVVVIFGSHFQDLSIFPRKAQKQELQGVGYTVPIVKKQEEKNVVVKLPFSI